MRIARAVVQSWLLMIDDATGGPGSFFSCEHEASPADQPYSFWSGHTKKVRRRPVPFLKAKHIMRDHSSSPAKLTCNPQCLIAAE